jgi:hypothetical protein
MEREGERAGEGGGGGGGGGRTEGGREGGREVEEWECVDKDKLYTGAFTVNICIL